MNPNAAEVLGMSIIGSEDDPCEKLRMRMPIAAGQPHHLASLVAGYCAVVDVDSALLVLATGQEPLDLEAIKERRTAVLDAVHALYLSTIPDTLAARAT